MVTPPTKTPLLVACAALIAGATIFHASMAFFYNMPRNGLTRALAPVEARYEGPQVAQGWSMFAPNPPTANVHVWARARTLAETNTAWYDVTQYYEDQMARDRVSPTHPLLEGLAHAVHDLQPSTVTSDPADLALVLRTSALVLRKRVPSVDLMALQVQVITTYIPSPSKPIHYPTRIRTWRTQWASFPMVDS